MIIAGIDYSITCPCICVYDNEKDFKFENMKVFFLDKRKKYAKKFGRNVFGLEHFDLKDKVERAIKISEWSMKIITKLGVEKVALEGYSFASKGNATIDIAENKMALKTELFKSNIEIFEPSPPAIKKFFAGKGNAKKEDMVIQFITETNVHLHNAMETSQMWSKPIEDIVDAYACCKWLNEKL